jgi:hypothetical protein
VSACKKDSQLSLGEAVKAIYIDYEGFEDCAPSLIGIVIGRTREQIVFDERLRHAATATGCRMGALREVMTELQQKCDREGRLIVAYSQHEKHVASRFAGVDLTPWYRDARKISKRWHRACRPGDAVAGHGLKDYLCVIDYPRGKHLGVQQTTSRLRAVAEMLGRRHEYRNLSPVVKAKWTKVLQHNAVDCHGMQALVLVAIAELALRERKITFRTAEEVELLLAMCLPAQ